MILNEVIAKEVVSKLRLLKKTVSTMESCTGGEVANVITSVNGASEVFNFGAVTYSNEYKIKFGVSPEIIEKYTVYSMETAKEMSFKISDFTLSDYGIGVTGKLNREDENNKFGSNNIIYVSIYDRLNRRFEVKNLRTKFQDRQENKNYIAGELLNLLNKML